MIFATLRGCEKNAGKQTMHPIRFLIRTIILCCFYSAQLLPVASAEVQLTAFQANYKFYYGKLKVANAQIKVSQTGDSWHWRLTTDPIGLLSLLTSRKPRDISMD